MQSSIPVQCSAVQSCGRKEAARSSGIMATNMVCFFCTETDWSNDGTVNAKSSVNLIFQIHQARQSSSAVLWALVVPMACFG